MTIIDTKHAPGAIGPYSQAYETNGLVITSGQLPPSPRNRALQYTHKAAFSHLPPCRPARSVFPHI